MDERSVAVLDVGKTIAKLSLWDASGHRVASATRPNAHVDGGGYRALDADSIDVWMGETLRDFAGRGRLGAIVPVGHGAAAAIVREGRLAAAPLDYETPIPPDVSRSYDALRDPFAATGSPRLPGGLNLGAQLHYLDHLRPGLLDQGASILPWPQYWAWRLCGVAACEVTSLGCHTDLWRPFEGRASDLALARGWADRLAPPARAADVLGPLSAEWIDRTGLSADVAVHCGLHDSNAALLAARGFAEIADGEATVLSTGTWFVALRSPGTPMTASDALPDGRDCLVNVDVQGRPVPSARFMGGREIEILAGGGIDAEAEQPALLAAVAAVVESGARVLPTFTPGFGPFASHPGRWIDEPAKGAARGAAVSLYAALMADVSLDLIGAHGAILVEGRFAAAEVFVRALARLRPRDRVYVAETGADVAFGALRLVDPAVRPAGALRCVAPLDADLAAYRSRWRTEAERAS